tara:strand:- start:271 stop:552 length:282 start_codon:yes stop_codon:yes gene_type:complete
MATLTIPANLSRVEGGLKVEVALDKQSTVSSILQQVQDEGIRQRLFDASGDPRGFLNVFLNGKNMAHVDGEDLVKAGANSDTEVYVLPIVAGG